MRKILVLIMLCCCFLTACGDGNNSETEIPYVADGEVGEIITPDENDIGYDLGEYRYSPSGTKLYFNDEEYSKELILTLEKYFISFAENDFETYKSCLSKEYIDDMSAFLEKNYNYGLETSFENQRKGLSEKMNGDFHITRLKAEKTTETTDDNIQEYFSAFNDFFGKDFYSEIKDNFDSFYNMTFYVMAENTENVESLLLSEYEIVFAEKDGFYYTFG